MALDRKEQIYTTARSLFRERGYPATTVRDIARELNMQAGSLYAHIGSKEDVLWEIVNRAADEFITAVGPIVEAAGLRPAERLRQMVRAHVQVVAGNLADATVFLHEWKFLGEARRTSVAERRRLYEGYYRQVIEQGIAEGDFAPCDSKIAALVVLSSVNWMPQWYRTDGPLSPTIIADEMVGLILKGLEPR